MIAGRVASNASLLAGSGFTVERFLAAGSYRVTLLTVPNGQPFVPVVSPSGMDTVARVSKLLVNALGQNVFEVEIRTVALPSQRIDSEFAFVVVPIS